MRALVSARRIRPDEQTRSVDSSGRSAVPLPLGFGIELDTETREISAGVWFGGTPTRVLRLTDAGLPVWERLRNAGVTDRASGLLARWLVQAGIAHPIPPTAQTPDVTVIVPVRDRALELDRCLTSLGDSFPVLVVDDASADAVAVRTIAHRHGARLLRLAGNLGPGGARNAGLRCVETELVAFADSDTEPGPTWIAELAAHLADPIVAAAAPRIVAADPGGGDASRHRTALTGYNQVRSSLDLGPLPAAVTQYGRVAYVPTTALVARTATVRDVGGFDESLRYGEDVDLIWRLTSVNPASANYVVRYVPAVRVSHHEPSTWPGLLARRYRYGTSAAPLSRRHPAAIAPLLVHPAYTATVAAALAGRPLLAGAALTVTAARTRRSTRRAGLPTRVCGEQIAAGLRRTWTSTGEYAITFALPVALAALARRRARAAATGLLLGPPLLDWLTRRPALDPLRFTIARIADDAAYGAGVIAGCICERTTVPLRPVLIRARARP